MLNVIVKALRNKVEKINAKSHYLNQFYKDLNESDGLLSKNGKLVNLFYFKKRGHEDST